VANVQPLAEPLAGELLVERAAELWVEARSWEPELHLPGVRARYRGQLELAIDCAERALDVGAAADARGELALLLRRTLVLAHAARARDARHGANQLSLSAQRAPTSDACDDGWRAVRAIVENAEASARAAERSAAVLDEPSGIVAAQNARRAAEAARRLIDDRNHAYTFHADPAFSFGEGWYLAAAAVLTGVTMQIEPGKSQTAQAERFLHDAGLAAQLAPYRPRPRANKALPDLVARAFRADPAGAQAKLRAAFLGRDAPSVEVVAFVDQALERAASSRKVLLWVRRGAHHAHRNTEHAELLALAERALAHGLAPVLVGDALPEGTPPAGAADLMLFWKRAPFQGLDMRRAQLQFFEYLRRAHGLVGQLGVTTAGMDGPALLGLPTMYLTDQPNDRLGRWVGAVPGYEEVVRQDGYLDRISRTLQAWAQ